MRLAEGIVLDTVATATFKGADVDWYIKADNIVLRTPKKEGDIQKNNK